MASSKMATVALFLALNLVFFSVVSGCGSYCPRPRPRPKPRPRPCPSPPYPSTNGRCPIDTLKLAACANVLNVVIGTPPRMPCCALLQGLVDLEAAVCLCTAIRANILGINLNVPIDLSLLLNHCGRRIPTGFQCP